MSGAFKLKFITKAKSVYKSLYHYLKNTSLFFFLYLNMMLLLLQYARWTKLEIQLLLVYRINLAEALWCVSVVLTLMQRLCCRAFKSLYWHLSSSLKPICLHLFVCLCSTMKSCLLQIICFSVNLSTYWLCNLLNGPSSTSFLSVSIFYSETESSAVTLVVTEYIFLYSLQMLMLFKVKFHRSLCHILFPTLLSTAKSTTANLW